MAPRKKRARKKTDTSAAAASMASTSNAIAVANASTTGGAEHKDKQEEAIRGFMDLPAELRCRIYGYVLGEDRPIRLRIDKGSLFPDRQIRRRGNGSMKQRGAVWNRKTKTYDWPVAKYSSILYTSKNVYLEAEPVLYGENVFELDTTTVLKGFLEIIGKRAQHLRFIRIANLGYMTSNAPSAFKMLSAAGGLRKLELGHQDFCYLPTSRYDSVRLVTIREVAQDCKALAMSLRHTYGDRDLAVDIPGVFCIYTSSDCRICSDPIRIGLGNLSDRTVHHRQLYWGGGYYGCKCAESEKHNEVLEHDLRKLIEEQLEAAVEAEQSET